MCVLSLTMGLTVGAVLADVALTAVAARGVLSTIAGVQQVDAQQDQAKYQAEVAAANARLADREAERIELASNQQRTALLHEVQQTRGSARAGYAAHGVVLGSGTVLDYEADVAQTYDLDLKNLNYDVENRKWQSRVHAANYRAQSQMYAEQAEAIGKRKAPTVIGGAISTLGSMATTAVGAVSGMGGLPALGTAGGAEAIEVFTGPDKWGWTSGGY